MLRMPVTKYARNHALKALDGMEEIVGAEMFVRGEYFEEEITAPERKGNICGGRRYCAVGSLWAAYGVKLRRNEWGDISLPGITTFERDKFLVRRPGLHLAYKSLNDAASEYITKHQIPVGHTSHGVGRCIDRIDPVFHSSLEGLFEAVKSETDPETGEHLGFVGRVELLEVIEAARQKVLAA